MFRPLSVPIDSDSLIFRVPMFSIWFPIRLPFLCWGRLAFHMVLFCGEDYSGPSLDWCYESGIYCFPVTSLHGFHCFLFLVLFSLFRFCFRSPSFVLAFPPLLSLPSLARLFTCFILISRHVFSVTLESSVLEHVLSFKWPCRRFYSHESCSISEGCHRLFGLSALFSCSLHSVHFHFVMFVWFGSIPSSVTLLLVGYVRKFFVSACYSRARQFGVAVFKLL